MNRSLLAFLNADGGTLYIGIDDDGKVCGIDNIDLVLRQTTDSFRDSVTPDPTNFFKAEPIKMDGKHVIRITVERGTMVPYCFSAYGLVPQGVYVRVGSTSAQATREHIRQMIRVNGNEKYIEELSLEQGLTFNYAEKVFAEKNVLFGFSQKQSLGLIRPDGRFTNLAVLLSDQCPYSIKAAIFQGSSKGIFKDRKEFTGSLFSQLDGVIDYLNVYNKVSSTFRGIHRIDHPDYPDVVIREAVLNSIIHRDYYIEGSTLVSLFDDRLEIMSLGGAMPGVTKEMMLAGVSVSRNEKLATVFYRLRIIEAYGTGIPKIFKEYADHNTEPDIPIVNGGFLISLPNLNYLRSRNAADMNTENGDAKEHLILNVFRGRAFTKEEVAEVLRFSANGTYKLLRRMVKDGSLTTEKQGKEFIYRVI